ncbi:BTB/POZ and MATH domain-containing protein 1 [Brachypodium distachyon]|uniref:BTB/POZ and MATH domain-containing protein 1 n=1 Tax=Brachypodium distachyon TaxID=15368 RepID=UPI00052FE673|nr:BTB/POZ and MATH domain-containing protein 1 [Brachypodium distachyon]|eukprot:XP_010227286.1 BTB/POZ and MATH domain-containing protein 1 [Brachypodium distachyon]
MADQNAAATVLRETSSRCVTECGAHNFEVTNYALLSGMGIGNFVSSSTFCVGGYGWNIRFYPDGAKNAPAGYASAFLANLSETKDKVTTKYTLTMLDKDGQVVANKELLGQLEHVLKDGKGADIKLLVGGREFNAHRFMLAVWSPVFHAQLLGPMAEEDTTRVIEVVNMEPAVFEMLLHFIYTDSLPPCDGEEGYGAPEMQHLLVAADRYGLDRLKAMCEEKLCKSIDMKTVTSTLALANQHFCERLKNACEEFMSKPGRVSTVLLSEGFRRVMATCFPLVLKDKEVPATKKEV